MLNKKLKILMLKSGMTKIELLKLKLYYAIV